MSTQDLYLLGQRRGCIDSAQPFFHLQMLNFATQLHPALCTRHHPVNFNFATALC